MPRQPGFSHTDATRAKMRAAKLGKAKSVETRAAMSAAQKAVRSEKKRAVLVARNKSRTGHRVPLAVRQKISATMRAQHGTTDIEQGHRNRWRDPRYREWRRKVLFRDDFTCRGCGSTSPLEAHHVLPWAHFQELRFVVDNGLTLCDKCHAAVDPQRRKRLKTGDLK